MKCRLKISEPKNFRCRVHESSRWCLNPKINSYGSGAVEIFDLCILDSKGRISNKIEKGTSFTVKMAVRFNENVNDPIFAFTILDLQGTDITGTNTMYEKTDVTDAKKGDICEISFTQQMDLQGGEYLISLGCTGFTRCAALR